MYKRTFWVDDAPDAGQQGTLQDQAHFNNVEQGISDNQLAVSIAMFRQRQDGYDKTDEVHEVTLAQTSSKWPFNNAATTVALSQLRETADYNVDINVLSYSGRLGHIEVKERARNGFKLLHDGSATNVKVSVRVSGGLIV